MVGQKVVNKRIGEILIDAGKIDEELLNKALAEQKKSGKRLGEILIDMEFVTEEDIILSLSTQYQIPFINLDSYEIDKEILNIIPKGLAMKYNCLPLDKIGDFISFVISDPGNLIDLKKQESFLNCKMQFFVTTPKSIKEALNKYYGS